MVKNRSNRYVNKPDNIISLIKLKLIGLIISLKDDLNLVVNFNCRSILRRRRVHDNIKDSIINKSELKK
jgi:hypothetical protein